MREVETILERIKPERITTLFVGESPPHGGTFFYNEDSILFSAMRKAFENARQETFAGKGVFLKHFEGCGFYLDDLVHEPINHLDDPIRRRMRRSGVQRLAESIREYNPQCVVILMFAIEQDVVNAIQNANLESYPVVHCVPFPANGHQKCFRELMQRIIPTLATDATILNGKKSK